MFEHSFPHLLRLVCGVKSRNVVDENNEEPEKLSGNQSEAGDVFRNAFGNMTPMLNIIC